MPVAIGLSGMLYGVAAVVLGGGFLYQVVRVWRDDGLATARSLFFYSIFYLFLIFVALLVDRGLQVLPV